MSSYPQWGWGSPFLSPSIFPQAGEAWGREGKNSIFHHRQVCPSVCPLAAGGRPFPVLGSHMGSEGSARPEPAPGASMVALASVAAGRPLPWNVPWRTQHRLGSRHPPLLDSHLFPIPVPTPPLFLTFNSNWAGSAFPPGKMLITFFSRDVDIFFQSPRALTQAHESHFRRGESLGSRLDKAEVQTQGWALDWLCDCGGVAQPL